MSTTSIFGTSRVTGTFAAGLASLMLLAAPWSPTQAAAPTITFPTTPLSYSAVIPNMMFLLDNSQTMKNIMWDINGPLQDGNGYDPTVDYSSTPYINWATWTQNVDSLSLSSLANTYTTPIPSSVTLKCLSGYVIGANKISGTWNYECLKLPDPVGGGGDTYYGTNYLNYLFNAYGTKIVYPASATTSNSIDLTNTTTYPNFPRDYRLHVAQTVTNTIVASPANNTTIDFCLSYIDFNNSNGTTTATIPDYCAARTSSTDITNFQSDVNSISFTSTGTPLAGAYYELTRYFRGLPPFYRKNTDVNNYNYSGTSSGKNAPIPLQGQPRCQHNFITVITDGYPLLDTYFPSSGNTGGDTQLTNPLTGTAVPNYDNLAPVGSMTSSTFPANAPQYSDGWYPTSLLCSGYNPYNSNAIQPSCSAQQGFTLYLDDLADFGAHTNITKLNGTNDPSGHDYSTYTRNIETFTISLTTHNQMMDDAAAYGGSGSAYLANSYSQLLAAMNSQIAVAQATDASAASIAGGSVSANAIVYEATYTTKAWTGDVNAYAVVPSALATTTCPSLTTVGALCNLFSFDAVNANIHTSAGYTGRSVYTIDPALAASARVGSQFKVTSGTVTPAGVKAILDINPDTLTADANSQYRGTYLLGDNSCESGQPKSGTSTCGGLSLRTRNELLGDIVDSSPFFLGPPNQDYTDTGYSTFKSSNATRASMVYAGGNDGMLHAFQADTGTEKFAYIPSLVWGSTTSPLLSKFTSANYTHLFYVDGQITAADAKLESGTVTGWKTVLIGGLGTGGRGFYALDVTTPTSFSSSSVLWEFTSADDSNLGYSLGQPSIIKASDGHWYAIITSGYNNGSTNGYVYFLRIDRAGLTSWSLGNNYFRIALPTTYTNGNSTSTVPYGVGTPAAIDYDGDGLADTVYVGDLYGNLWKIDIRSFSSSIAAPSMPLFSASKTPANVSINGLPITDRPDIGYNPLYPGQKTKLMVYFGSGKFMESSDKSTTTQQYMYGVFDNVVGNPTSTITPDKLLSQTITDNVSGGYRTVTNNSYSATPQSGFVLALPDSGERIVSNPLLADGRIIFSTLIPSNDPCASGGATGWIMELNAANGGPVAGEPLLDTNKDGKVNASDSSYGAGLYFGNGAPGTPTLVDVGNGKQDVIGNQTGTPLQFVQNSNARTGRVNWYELTP